MRSHHRQVGRQVAARPTARARAPMCKTAGSLSDSRLSLAHAIISKLLDERHDRAFHCRVQARRLVGFKDCPRRPARGLCCWLPKQKRRTRRLQGRSVQLLELYCQSLRRPAGPDRLSPWPSRRHGAGRRALSLAGGPHGGTADEQVLRLLFPSEFGGLYCETNDHMAAFKWCKFQWIDQTICEENFLWNTMFANTGVKKPETWNYPRSGTFFVTRARAFVVIQRVCIRRFY